MPGPIGIMSALEPRTAEGARAIALARSLCPFLREQAGRNDAAGTFAHASIERLRAEGVLGICAPESQGGLGVTSLYDVSLVLAELGRGDGSVAVAASMHLALTCYYARSVRTSGAEPSRHAPWLEQVGRRAMVIASAVAETGREAWRVMTTARRAAEGWVISGEKILVSISPAATHLYTRLRAETPGGHVMATAMIPTTAAGVTICDDWQGLGLRGSGSGRVKLDGVAVAEADLRLGGTWGIPDPTDYEGRAASSIPIMGAYLGMAEAAHDLAVSEFERASASGGPRARTEAVALRSQLAEVMIALGEIRSVMHCVASSVEEVFQSTRPRTVDPEVGRTLLRECVVAALVIERATARAVDGAMQICGGRSYGAGHELARIYRDTKAESFMRPYSPPERYVEFLTQREDTG